MSGVFEFNSYKPFLKEHIKTNVKRGYQATLARACGCQPSYLSQVMSGKAHLTEDHVAGMAGFVGMSKLETDYLLCLVQTERAASVQLKAFLRSKADDLRARQNELRERIPNVKKSKPDIEKFYFSSWYWSAIHVATSVPEYQTAEALAERFALPLVKVREVLEKLQSIGFVALEHSRWKYKTGAAHLAREAVMTELNHTHWRHRAVRDIQIDTGESLHYTSVVAMTKADALKMREVLIQTIAKTRTISDPSECEEVYCFDMDFFRA